MNEQIQFLMNGSLPVLKTDAERDAFRQMNAAKRQVQHFERLKKRTHADAMKLGHARRRYRLAREQILRCNLGLVISMARKSRARNIDFEELVLEGTLILTRSVDKFKVTKGTKFSTYACRALINGFVRMGILQGRKDSKSVTDHELAMQSVETATFDTHLGLEIDELKGILRRNLANLTKPEKKVIQKRFGLRGKPQTLEQVGAALDLSKERVRQLQVDALAKLRVVMDDSLGSKKKLSGVAKQVSDIACLDHAKETP